MLGHVGVSPYRIIIFVSNGLELILSGAEREHFEDVCQGMECGSLAGPSRYCLAWARARRRHRFLPKRHRPPEQLGGQASVWVRVCRGRGLSIVETETEVPS